MGEEDRDQWGSQLEFVLTLVGYAVGLGNVWRFPYLCFQNGGGAFLIPYVGCLILLGIPIFALECAFGQYGGKGPLSIWTINPLFKGVGITTIVTLSIMTTYYNIIIAQALRYLVASFTLDLPWLECKSCECLTYKQNLTSFEVERLKYNNSLNIECPSISTNVLDAKSPSEVYYFDDILKDSGSLEEIGSVRWELLVCNFVAILVVFVVLIKGIASLGKVIYFTTIFPYVLLTIFLVRAAMLDGAGDGVEYYLKPDWSQLTKGKVWSDAATQIFFSLSACAGGLIAMSSYNKFNNNIIRDAFVVPIINCGTSFFSGFVVFCTLGYMAKTKGVPIEEVTRGGPGLVFVVYPEAIGEMPASTLWAVLFFFMLCILGFSSQFSAAESVMTCMVDEFPNFFEDRRRQIVMRFAVCMASFVLAIPFTTEGGQHLLSLVDGATVGFPILFMGLIEIIIIIYIYGYKNFADDIECMVGFRPYKYFQATWCVLTPFTLTAVIVFKAYETEDFHPAWKGFLYYFIVLLCMIWIPLGFLYRARDALTEAMRPEQSWLDRRALGGSIPENKEDKEMREYWQGKENKGYEKDDNVIKTKF